MLYIRRFEFFNEEFLYTKSHSEFVKLIFLNSVKQ